MTVQITAGQFHAADGVEDWRSLYHVVSAHFRTSSLIRCYLPSRAVTKMPMREMTAASVATNAANLAFFVAAST